MYVLFCNHPHPQPPDHPEIPPLCPHDMRKEETSCGFSRFLIWMFFQPLFHGSCPNTSLKTHSGDWSFLTQLAWDFFLNKDMTLELCLCSVPQVSLKLLLILLKKIKTNDAFVQCGISRARVQTESHVCPRSMWTQQLPASTFSWWMSTVKPTEFCMMRTARSQKCLQYARLS